MLYSLIRKFKSAASIFKKTISNKKDFKNFIIAYLILRFEPIRLIVIKLIQMVKPKNEKLVAHYQNNPMLHSKLTTLKKDGNLILDKILPESIIESIKAQTTHLVCSDPYNKQVGSFRLEEAPAAVNIAGYRSQDLVKIPEVMQIANDPDILTLVQEYFGCAPTITGIEMWWSLTNRVKPQYAQLFHRDFDGIKFLKLFIYLTDVEKDDGPHIYITRSAPLRALRRPTRHTDEKMEQLFSSQIRAMCGQKGVIFLEDTFGLHKGSLPVRNNRLLLQVIYGMHSLVYEKYEPMKLAYPDYDSYINRLFLQVS